MRFFQHPPAWVKDSVIAGAVLSLLKALVTGLFGYGKERITADVRRENHDDTLDFQFKKSILETSNTLVKNLMVRVEMLETKVDALIAENNHYMTENDNLKNKIAESERLLHTASNTVIELQTQLDSAKDRIKEMDALLQNANNRVGELSRKPQE